MNQWQGKITEKSHKDWNGIKLYSFKIDGEDRWFRTQKIEIDEKVGEMVAFEERNSQVVSGSVKRVGATSNGATSQTVNDVQEPTAQTDSDRPDTGSAGSVDVGQRIRWQAARADASRVVVAALAADALPWAANVAKGKRLDLLRGYINELTRQFIEEEENG